MFISIYQFAIKPGGETQFTAAWQKTTEGFARFKGGLGSRLHRATNGVYIAYAQWPDEPTYRRANGIVMPAMYEHQQQRMHDCLKLSESRVLHELEVEIDCLRQGDLKQNNA